MCALSTPYTRKKYICINITVHDVKQLNSLTLLLLSMNDNQKAAPRIADSKLSNTVLLKCLKH